MDSLKEIFAGLREPGTTQEQESDVNWEAFFLSRNYDPDATEVLVRFAPSLKRLNVDFG